MKLGAFSPSSRVNKEDMDSAIARLSGYDVTLDYHAQTYAQHHQSAGTANDKIKALSDLLGSKDIDAIWASVGGNRCASMLDDIDALKTVLTTNKPLIGYSDVTFLLNAFYALTGQVNIHAPALQSLANDRITDDDITRLFDMLNALLRHEKFTIAFNKFTITNAAHQKDKDTITGTIIGGNLSLMQALIGTPYMPTDEPIILFLEDIGDQLSRYDRMFRHMRHSGLFDRCGAILIGDLAQAEDKSRTPFGFPADDIMHEHFSSLPCPVFTDLSFGHRGSFTPLPIGAKTSLRYNAQSLSLDFDF